VGMLFACWVSKTKITITTLTRSPVTRIYESSYRRVRGAPVDPLGLGCVRACVECIGMGRSPKANFPIYT
jgi:hypothetical protein